MAKNIPLDVQLSKALTWLLRHGAEKEGIIMEKDGFVKVDDILLHKTLKKATKEDLLRIVENCSKKRFLIKTENDVDYIRANQGHSLMSIQVDLVEITEADPIDQCVHGTYFKAWEQIKTSGLSKMGRQHIHLSEDFPGSKDVISGMRSNCQIAVYVDIKSAMRSGLKFYRSSNNVILCPGNENGYLETRFFSKVVDLKQGISSFN